MLNFIILETKTLKKIRILEIVFTPQIKGRELNAFRGAVANKVGHDSILFHNHSGNGFRYDYPLIQYKRLGKKASIVCIDQGVDEIHKLFNQPDWHVNLYGNEYELKIDNLKVEAYNLNVWDKYFYYRIFNWLALNPENHKKYEKIESLSERIEFLENILVGNILSFASGVDWFINGERKVDLKILDITEEKLVKFKNTYRKALNVEFKTNVFLPQHIGLGKAASHGFGVVYKIRKSHERN